MFLQNYTDIYIQLIISIWYTYIRDSLAWNMCSRDTDPSISSCAIHSTRCQTWRFLGFQKVVKGGKKILGIRPPPTYPSFWNSSPLKHHKQTNKNRTTNTEFWTWITANVWFIKLFPFILLQRSFLWKVVPKVLDHSAIRQPSPAIPEVQVNTLICEGIIFLSDKQWAKSPFWLRKFQGFSARFFSPGWGTLWSSFFLKVGSHRSSTVFPK